MTLIKTSEVRLSKGGFNNLESREKIVALLDKYIGGKYIVVNTDKEYWKNDNATLVISLKQSADIVDVTSFAHLVQDLRVDEFHTIVTGANVIVRFWWD